MVIAQVQVDDAYWDSSKTRKVPLARGDTAWISLPFPWVLGETHKVNFVTNTGATFEHEIAVAVPTPIATSGSLWSQAILGAFVGILPVAIGLMCYPALRGAGPGTMTFLLAMTVGLLAFLLVDTVVEALEFAEKSAAIFQYIFLRRKRPSPNDIWHLDLPRKRDGISSRKDYQPYLTPNLDLYLARLLSGLRLEPQRQKTISPDCRKGL